ncbi:MAG: hypothetical protein ACLUD7_03110 [Lachnospiraceae bacterium]
MEKERRTKALVVVVLLIVVAGLTVAFAALSTTLNINGTAYLDAAKWGIRFENLSSPTKIGSATTTGTAKIEESKSVEINGINVSLSTPGDKVTYTVDLVNKGTINAKIDKIEKTKLTSGQQKCLTFKVTDKDGIEVSEGDILSAGETRSLTITIEFIKDLTKEDLPASTSTISLSYKLNFVQTDEKATTSGSSKQACTSFDKKDTYSVGDVIALCNTSTNKSEDFYVIKDNGTTVTALAKYNLLVGNVVKWSDDFGSAESTMVIPSSEEGYGLQNSTAANYESNNGTPSTNTFTGVLGFSKDNNGKGYWVDDTSNHNLLSKYGNSYPAYVFDENSILYKPLSNYESYIKNTLKKTSVTTSLLTYDQVINLGCNKDNGSCKSAPSWVHAVNYWIGSVDASYSAEMVGHDMVDPAFGYGGLEENMAGLRPVITISKSEL